MFFFLCAGVRGKRARAHGAQPALPGDKGLNLLSAAQMTFGKVSGVQQQDPLLARKQVCM